MRVGKQRGFDLYWAYFQRITKIGNSMPMPFGFHRCVIRIACLCNFDFTGIHPEFLGSDIFLSEEKYKKGEGNEGGAPRYPLPFFLPGGF